MTALARWLTTYLDETEAPIAIPASEQLYYHDAPVAHVVAYEDQLREARLEPRIGGRGGFHAKRPLRPGAPGTL